jgi:hypothetical protein
MISREQFQMQGNENVKFVPMQQNELNIIFNLSSLESGTNTSTNSSKTDINIKL